MTKHDSIQERIEKLSEAVRLLGTPDGAEIIEWCSRIADVIEGQEGLEATVAWLDLQIEAAAQRRQRKI